MKSTRLCWSGKLTKSGFKRKQKESPRSETKAIAKDFASSSNLKRTQTHRAFWIICLKIPICRFHTISIWLQSITNVRNMSAWRKFSNHTLNISASLWQNALNLTLTRPKSANISLTGWLRRCRFWMTSSRLSAHQKIKRMQKPTWSHRFILPKSRLRPSFPCSFIVWRIPTLPHCKTKPRTLNVKLSNIPRF